MYITIYTHLNCMTARSKIQIVIVVRFLLQIISAQKNLTKHAVYDCTTA